MTIVVAVAVAVVDIMPSYRLLVAVVQALLVLQTVVVDDEDA